MIMILQIKCKLGRRAVLNRLRAPRSETFAEFTLSIALNLPNLVLELCWKCEAKSVNMQTNMAARYDRTT